ncbi:hypothetical protein J4444_03380 [Candidatus Woesearchaeota archaeon]|nr:hypothetical protein [Candidatus Woesearchaeota archaeon]
MDLPNPSEMVSMASQTPASLHDILLNGGFVPRLAEEQCNVSKYLQIGWTEYWMSERMLLMQKEAKETTLVSKAAFFMVSSPTRVDFMGSIVAPDRVIWEVHRPAVSDLDVKRYLVAVFESYTGGHTNIGEILDIIKPYVRDEHKKEFGKGYGHKRYLRDCS